MEEEEEVTWSKGGGEEATSKNSNNFQREGRDHVHLKRLFDENDLVNALDNGTKQRNNTGSYCPKEVPLEP